MHIGAFINIKPYEKIEYILRRNPITFAPYLLIFAVLLFVPPISYYLFSTAFVSAMQIPTTPIILTLVGSAYYMALGLFFFSFFVEFYLDCWILTNDRLIDVRQISLFSRTIAEVDLYQVQDVSSEIKGLFPTIFNYGNVYLQTAGVIPKFIILNVSHPDKLRQTILNLSSEDKKFHNI